MSTQHPSYPLSTDPTQLGSKLLAHHRMISLRHTQTAEQNLHNPTDALSIDTLFVSLEHRQILAGRDSRSPYAPAMKIHISEWLALRRQPHQHLNNRTPRRIHTPLGMSPTCPEHAPPHTPLTLSTFTPSLTLSSNPTDRPNTPKSMPSSNNRISFVVVSSSSESCTFRFSITAGFLPTHSPS
ncbi:hypothetical protein BLNAU_6011 [Blattamonas nauphoetae]|uniref:Uncharacterized protein n=1 Tax=Blattamonas nauphoetae TaxID=2049346 RepID=A0ABQ9Y5H2_9EUKA|nr:hypothetical protein BLNAU_6011 [Blattamonas nauphoetae]